MEMLRGLKSDLLADLQIYILDPLESYIYYGLQAANIVSF